jgi:hypothetical protein
MKHPYTLSVFFVLALLASCATVKTAKTPVPDGDWAYKITGTPQGDYEGVLTLTKTGDTYGGQMTSSEGTIALSSVTYSKEEKKITATFDYSGMPVTLTAVLADNQLTGTVATSGYEFPLSATRK